MASFSLTDPALHRIGAIVHFLDVGGIEPPEAGGLEQILLGLSQSINGDYNLLGASRPLFDGLYAAFRSGKTNER